MDSVIRLNVPSGSLSVNENLMFIQRLVVNGVPDSVTRDIFSSVIPERRAQVEANITNLIDGSILDPARGLLSAVVWIQLVDESLEVSANSARVS